MEHISKQEQRPKEGYLSEESAREAALTMEYKYGEPFRPYKCSVCQKWHVGRVNTLVENTENTVKDEVI